MPRYLSFFGVYLTRFLYKNVVPPNSICRNIWRVAKKDMMTQKHKQWFSVFAHIKWQWLMLLTSPQCSERCVKCGHRPLGSLWHWSMFKEKASKWNSGTGGSDEFGLCTLIFHATFKYLCCWKLPHSSLRIPPALWRDCFYRRSESVDSDFNRSTSDPVSAHGTWH